MSPRKIRKVIKVKVDPAVSSNVKSNITRGPVQVHVNKPSKPASVAAIRRSNVQPKFKQPTVFKPITKIWNASDTVYIIGGGPSLKNFKWSELNNKKTIAINKSLLSYPNADAVYWTDGRFL